MANKFNSGIVVSIVLLILAWFNKFYLILLLLTSLTHSVVLAASKPDFVDVNNKGADQAAQSRSLISTFVICSLESIIEYLSCKCSIFWLVSVADHAGFSLDWSHTDPKDGLSLNKAHF